MRPFHAAAAGVALLALDFRTTSLDLLPDVLGWLLLAYAAHRLRGGRWAAVPLAGAALSTATLVLPYHWIQIDPFTGEHVVVRPGLDLGYAELLEYDRLTGGRLAMAAGATVLGAVVAWLLVGPVARRAHDRGAPGSARRLRLGAVAFVVAWVVPRLIAMSTAAISGDGYDVVWDDPVSRVALVGVVGALAFAGVLASEGREPWALRPGTERTLPSVRERVA
ncbi:MAG TPA: hypothetical protein VFU14_03945 [Acidimicrobiales bacterium]|nr:hypothetical protein [Acidimicrobiales bacterium]